MPLPKEVLDQLKTQLDTAEARYKEALDAVEDMQAAGIDVVNELAALKAAEADLRRLKYFYELETRRS